jgi:tryptophan synthase alpha chain
MGYLNPVEMFGAARFAEAARDAGVDGVLLVDCPPEESAALGASLDGAGLRQIFLAAPTSQGARLESLARRARGYIYYVSFAGVTGRTGSSSATSNPRVARARKLSAAPVAVGFGVKEPAQASAIAAFADAVVVGSALVQRLHAAADPVSEARAFLAPLRAALDAAQHGSKRTSV